MSNSDDDSLTVIPPEDWPELRDLYQANWPANLVAYHTVDNFIQWHRKDPHIRNLTFYSLNGTWRQDGTYVIVDRYQLFLYTLAADISVLERALHLLDWSRGFKVSSFLARHRNAVINVIDSKGLRKEYDSCTYLYYMSRDDSARLECNVPEGFRLGKLSPEDAAKADAVWPNRHCGSLFFLQRLAAWNPNVGLYNSSGELVAWCFSYVLDDEEYLAITDRISGSFTQLNHRRFITILQAGPLGALQVDERHLKRGYGSIVTAAMAKQLAEINQDCFALVGNGNVPSKRMFEKLGFRHTDFAYWTRTYPTSPFQWTDD